MRCAWVGNEPQGRFHFIMQSSLAVDRSCSVLKGAFTGYMPNNVNGNADQAGRHLTTEYGSPDWRKHVPESQNDQSQQENHRSETDFSREILDVSSSLDLL